MQSAQLNNKRMPNISKRCIRAIETFMTLIHISVRGPTDIVSGFRPLFIPNTQREGPRIRSLSPLTLRTQHIRTITGIS